MSASVRAFGGFLLVVVCGGCGSALADGESQFKKGRYPEAKQTFASIEDDAKHYDDTKRAEYALYRGLTFGALGDRVRSALWLRLPMHSPRFRTSAPGGTATSPRRNSSSRRRSIA